MKIAVFLADGFEEVEAFTLVDYLRRTGMDVPLVGIGKKILTGAHGVRVESDEVIDNFSSTLDAVALPGGMPGAENLAASAKVELLCRTLLGEGKLVAAICAAPVVALDAFGLLKERRFTCYPSFEKNANDGIFCEDRVVVDRNLITSRGPGTAGELAVEIIRYLLGDEMAQKIENDVLLRA